MFRSRPIREAMIFVGLSYLIAVLIALAMPRGELTVMLSALIPVLSVGIMTFTVFRRGSRKPMWAGIGLQRAGWRWWPAAIAGPVIVVAIAYGTAVVLGVADLRSPTGLLPWLSANGGSFVINVLVVLVVIMGEEIGWRGFLLPRIQTELRRRSAAVATGFIHGLFHLPLILLTTLYDNIGSRWIVAPMVVVVITGGGVLYAWVRDHSASVWPANIAHVTVNILFGVGSTATITASPVALEYIAGEGGFATAAAVWLIAGALLLAKSQWRGPVRDAAPTPRDRVPVNA
jgi:uncharacterized protein